MVTRCVSEGSGRRSRSQLAAQDDRGGRGSSAVRRDESRAERLAFQMNRALKVPLFGLRLEEGYSRLRREASRGTRCLPMSTIDERRVPTKKGDPCGSPFPLRRTLHPECPTSIRIGGTSGPQPFGRRQSAPSVAAPFAARSGSTGRCLSSIRQIDHATSGELPDRRGRSCHSIVGAIESR